MQPWSSNIRLERPQNSIQKPQLFTPFLLSPRVTLYTGVTPDFLFRFSAPIWEWRQDASLHVDKPISVAAIYKSAFPHQVYQHYPSSWFIFTIPHDSTWLLLLPNHCPPPPNFFFRSSLKCCFPVESYRWLVRVSIVVWRGVLRLCEDVICNWWPGAVAVVNSSSFFRSWWWGDSITVCLMCSILHYFR